MILLSWIGTDNTSIGDDIAFFVGVGFVILMCLGILAGAIVVIIRNIKTIRSNARWYYKLGALFLLVIAAYIAGTIVFSLT